MRKGINRKYIVLFIVGFLILTGVNISTSDNISENQNSIWYGINKSYSNYNGDPVLVELVMCEWVESYGVHGPAKTEFQYGKLPYCYSGYTGIDIGDLGSHRWYLNGNLFFIAEKVNDQYEGKVAHYSWPLDMPIPSGNYRVSVYINNKKYGSVEFTVLEKPDLLEVNWEYPSSAVINEPYEIILKVNNKAEVSQNFNYGLNYEVLNNNLPDWVKESSTCKLNNNNYIFGQTKIQPVSPGLTTIRFTVCNSWHWIPPYNIGQVVLDLILSTPFASIIDFLIFVETRLNSVSELNCLYNGIAESATHSGFNINAQISDTKQDLLWQSYLMGFGGNIFTVAALITSAIPVLNVGALPLFLSEAASLITAELFYIGSYDPDPYYVEIVQLEPSYYPKVNISDEFKLTYKSAMDIIPLAKAFEESYIKYLGAQKDSNIEWEKIQKSSSLFYLSEIENNLNIINNDFQNLFENIPEIYQDDISSIRNYFINNSLPEIEKDVLKYYGYNDDALNSIMKFFINADDEFYLNVNNITQIVKNFCNNIAPLSETIDNENNNTYNFNIFLNPSTIDITSPPDTISYYLEVENESDLDNYKINSVLLNNEIQPKKIYLEPGDFNNNGYQDIEIEFNTDDIINLLKEGNKITIINGNITTPGLDNLSFYETQIITLNSGKSPIKPDKPIGNKIGFIDKEHEFKTSTIDPENSTVFYYWDWNDGNYSGWIGPYNSGDICLINYSWNKKGGYDVKVKAKDFSGHESEWSDPLTTLILKSKSCDNNILKLFFERLIYRFPIFERILNQIIL